MQTVELIQKTRDHKELSTSEITWLIDEYAHGTIPDYQMSAWLMAVYCQGISARETGDLTLAMAQSGEQLHVRDIISPVVDKHSTGGVGDKVTLAVAPLVAACGISVGKMTGRGLGHTGGTVDKLESVSGFRSELSRAEFMHILTQHQIVLAGQSQDLAPADGKLYALRDVTGTIESIPLIAASIMSKKIAIGASHLLLDVKFGSGAFMKTSSLARQLAYAMVDIGKASGLHTIAALTTMDQPLGRAIGNALELVEAIAILRGEGPPDVSELCHHEAEHLLVMTGKAKTLAAAIPIVQQAITSGKALEKLIEVITAQGGNARQIEYPEQLPQARVRTMLKAPQTGYIASIHAEKLGIASMHLGAGRVKKGDPIDHSTGLILQAKVGDFLHVGDPLIEIHGRNDDEIASISPLILGCYTWDDSSCKVGPIIHEVIHP